MKKIIIASLFFFNHRRVDYIFMIKSCIFLIWWNIVLGAVIILHLMLLQRQSLVDAFLRYRMFISMVVADKSNTLKHTQRGGLNQQHFNRSLLVESLHTYRTTPRSFGCNLKNMRIGSIWWNEHKQLNLHGWY